MAHDTSQVAGLKQAIMQRANTLAEEHIKQGQATRSRIMDDAREKVQLMEQKELLAAKENAERHFHRRVQANEIKLQAEMDRNRWGLVQSVMDQVLQSVEELAANTEEYDPVFRRLLKQAAQMIGSDQLVAQVNERDRNHYQAKWQELVREETGVEVELSEEHCSCSGGVKLFNADRSIQVNNTFEGLVERRNDALMQVIFERLFATVPSVGVNTHG
jgi:V/A-type H+-transporting ATPase subunit E